MLRPTPPIAPFFLSGADSFVNVVTFSETARVLLTNTTTLVRADEANADELIDLVRNLEVGVCVRLRCSSSPLKLCLCSLLFGAVEGQLLLPLL